MADDERIRNAMCTGKHRHDTFHAAHQQAKVGRRFTKGFKSKRKIAAYKCRFCSGFHVGHSRRKRRRKNGYRRNKHRERDHEGRIAIRGEIVP